MPWNLASFFAGTLTIVLFTLSACGPVGRTVPDTYSTLTDTTGLTVDMSQAPTVMYKRPGAPTLADYTRFIVDPIRVNYDDPDMQELDPEQIDEMQRYFHGTMIRELREAGYDVGTRTEPDTLRMTFTVSGLKAWTGGGAANVAAMAGGMAVGIPVGVFSISVGEVTVECVFQNAVENRVDAVVVSHTGGSRMFKAKPWSTWADVEGAFDRWAEGIREAIDKAHGR